ncbi:RnfABCDGE type electron transport complex subunit D [Halobacillus shinanisalinarum]|uniref:RnfABCDGE type electron transport complex subunit D n=1 Tax=Halobacillus shinanisalinarum TaxID=2932258 RepID=A0ABY4H1G1_9BACI|nr:RnfABCDGE type electron transport complex subunit D [Halobacillus shinanisalinarum]UOQ94005.1 RnfABCDGE type electron transport complex subunit D [Halobacillus shinanisalinarum]
MGVIRDPRIMQIMLLGTYALTGKMLLQLQFTVIQMVVTLTVCILLEWFFVYLKNGTVMWPHSAVITSLGIVLVLRADTVIPFIMASLVAIGFKHLLRYRESHIFNPSNIGISMIVVLFPLTTSTDPVQWGFYLWILAVMSLGGLYLVHKVHRLPLVLSFFFSFVGIQWIRHIIWTDALNASFSSFMWAGLFVFTFNMITDPKTSPKDVKKQIYFGSSIALTSQVIIHLNIHSALFISLAIICLGQFLWKWVRDLSMSKGKQASVKTN